MEVRGETERFFADTIGKGGAGTEWKRRRQIRWITLQK